MSADPFEPIVSVIAASTPARILASASAGLARGWRHSRLARHSERIRRFRRLPAPTRVRVTAVFTLCALVASLVVTRIIPRAMRPMVPAVCWYTLLIFGVVVAAMADDLVRAWPTSTLRRLSGRLRIGSVFLLSVFLCSGAGAQTPPPKSDIGAAFVDSLKLLMVEHGTRIACQQKTRRELAGPFIKETPGSSTTSAIRFTAPRPV